MQKQREDRMRQNTKIEAEELRDSKGADKREKNSIIKKIYMYSITMYSI